MKFIIVLLFALTTFAQQKTVYVAYIDGEIDLGLAPYISRVVSEASKTMLMQLYLRSIHSAAELMQQHK